MITLSHTLKPSRKEAFDILVAAKSRALSECEIDSLINYFAPAVPSAPKTAFQWVARAVAIDDVRQYLHFVNVSSGVMRATDGHRLHWATTDLPDGNYDAKTGLRVDDNFVRGSFPDISRVIPSIDRMQAAASDPAQGVRRIGKKDVFTLDYGGVIFNKSYIDAASPDSVYIDQEKMRGSNAFGEFVIMCMRG